MKAFLLAAGFGERLRPLTDKTPKPLIPVSGIPSICYSLMLLKEAGITDVVCNIHYHPDRIMDFFKKNSNFGFNIDFSFEKEILGTGGGLKQCERYFNDDDFIVLNSDIITDLKLQDVIAGFKNTDSPGTVVLYNSINIEKTVSIMGNHVKDFRDFSSSACFSEDKAHCSGSSLTNLVPLEPIKTADVPRSFCSSWTRALIVGASSASS